jgi:hypothetical protein
MSWTYDPSDMDSALNRVRLRIGDVNESDPQMQDEEIQLFIDATSTDEDAAYSALTALAARYARESDKWVGDLKILKSQKFRAIKDLLANIEPSTRFIGIPSAGGIRYSQKEEIEGDSDLVTPSFRRNQFDYEGDPS